jgi:beta-glucosidase
LTKKTLAVGGSLDLFVTVTNTGQRRAAEVVQVYLSDLEASAPVPIHKLVDFVRLDLDPGESQELDFTITPEAMSFFDEEGQLRLEPGEFCATVGGCSPGERGRALGAPEPVTGNFTVR